MTTRRTKLARQQRAFHGFFGSLGKGAFLVDARGVVCAVNPSFEKLTGYSADALLGRPAEDILVGIETGDTAGPARDAKRAYDRRTTALLKRENGEVTELSVVRTAVRLDGESGTLYLIEDSLESSELIRSMFSGSSFLSLCVKKKSRREFLDAVVGLVASLSGCENVGIRVLTRELYAPYESYRGFSPEWWESENMLSVDRDQCVCSRVIEGILNPEELPATTPGGSFHVDDFHEFFDSLPEDKKKKYRGACARCGYRSMAVIPIRSEDRILGALHVADDKPGTIQSKLVEFLESMNNLVAEAIMRFDMEEELNRNLDTQRVISKILELQVEDIPLEEIFERTLDLILSISWLSFESRGMIFLADPETKTLEMKAARGITHALRNKCAVVPFGACLCGKTAETGELYFADRMDVNHETTCPDKRPHGHYCIPFKRHDMLLGILNIYIKEGHIRTEREVEFLTSVSNTLAEIIIRKRTERQLERSNRRNQAILEAAGEGLYGVDRDGFITFANPAAAEMTGFDLDELIGGRQHELLHYSDPGSRDASADECMVCRTLTDGVSRSATDAVFRRKNGENFQVEFTGTPVVENGVITGSVVVFRDITERKAAEEALRKSEASLANAQRISRMGNWEWDIATNEVYWSNEIYRIFGIRPEEFTPSYGSFVDLIHPDDREYVLNAIEDTLQRNKPYNIECRIVLRNGVTLIINAQGEVIRDENGRPVRMIGTVQDISDQKLARKQHARLASFPEMNPYPIIETDLAGSVTYLNPMASKLFPEILVDGAEHPVLRGLVELIPSLSYNKEKNMVIGMTLGDRFYEQRVSYIPESKRLRSYIIDITERKQAENLKENMSRLKDNLLSAMLIISGKLDLETALKETLLTAKRLLHAKYAAFAVIEDTKITKFLHDGMTGEEVKRMKKCPPMSGLIETLIRERKTIRVSDIRSDLRFRGFPDGHTDMDTFLGTPIIFRDTMLGIIYISGKTTGGAFTEQDEEIFESMAAHAAVAVNNARLYEQIKRFNEELEDMIRERTRELEEAVNAARIANNAKSEFLANMSHELRTPLNAIIGFAQLLGETYFGPLTEKQSEFIENILVSSQHLLNLINDILDLSKVEAGKMELEISEVDIANLLENSLIMIKEKAMKHNIILEVNIDDVRGMTIRADDRKLKQIMFNLLSNAAKYTPDGGAITVSASPGDRELTISVTDTGMGISPEFQEKIFEEFYQLNNEHAGKSPGTGLGLSLVKRFVEMHDGRVWVESEGEGSGSTFGFTLPLRTSRYDEEDE